MEKKEFKKYIEEHCFKGDLFATAKKEFNVDDEMIARIREKISYLEGIEKFQGKLFNILRKVFVLLDAKESSKIEGTISTITKIESPGETDDETKKVRNYKNAFLNGMESVIKNKFLNIRMLNEVHRELDDAVIPGEIRREQNCIGLNSNRIEINNIKFIPICTDKLKDELDKFEKFINDNENLSFKEKIIKTGIAHAMFEIMHPYDDGNGRVGRMLITFLLILMKINFPVVFISRIFSEESKTYKDNLNKITKKNNEVDYSDWVNYYLKSFDKTLDKTFHNIEDISKYFEEIKNQIKNEAKTRYYMEVAEYIFKNRAFRQADFIKYMKEKHGIGSSVSSEILSKLQKIRILDVEEEGKGRKSTILIFPDLLEKLESYN